MSDPHMMCLDEHGEWVCTRRRGHLREHAAVDDMEGVVHATWGGVDPSDAEVEAERDRARSIAVSVGAAAQQTITELKAERDHLDAQLSSNSLALLRAALTIERVRAALDEQDRIHHADPDDDCSGCAIDAIRTALDQGGDEVRDARLDEARDMAALWKKVARRAVGRANALREEMDYWESNATLDLEDDA